MSRRGWLLFATMSVIWGVPYLLIKITVAEVSPALLVLARTAIAAAVLVPIAASHRVFRPVLRRWRPLVAYSLIEILVPWWLLSTAEQRLSSSLTGLLVAATPLVGAVLARVTGAEHLNGRRLGGLALGLAGVGALLGLDIGGVDLRSALAVLLVAVCYAVGPFILATWLDGMPGLGVVAASLVVATAVNLPFGLTQLPARIPSGATLAAVVILALVCTALAFVVFYELVATVGAARATIITYVNPAVAIALGVSVLGEPFTVPTAVGFALVLAGSVLATGSPRLARRDGSAVSVEGAQPVVPDS